MTKNLYPLRDTVMNALRDAGVTQVRANFEGSGDSGQVEDIEVLPDGKDDILKLPIGEPRKRGDWVDGGYAEVTRPDTLQEAIESLCYDLLGNHPGWEINEGSFGEFVIEPGADKIGLTYNERVETYETSEEEY